MLNNAFNIAFRDLPFEAQNEVLCLLGEMLVHQDSFNEIDSPFYIKPRLKKIEEIFKHYYVDSVA